MNIACLFTALTPVLRECSKYLLQSQEKELLREGSVTNALVFFKYQFFKNIFIHRVTEEFNTENLK